MSCDIYENYEAGQVSRATFEEHISVCPECNTKWSRDAQILKLAQSLSRPVNRPELWPQIERGLRNEIASDRKIFKWPVSISKYYRFIRGAAAVLIIAVSITVFLQKGEAIPEKGLISASVLKKVQDRETEYMQAIAELEKVAAHKMTAMDINLMLLYRDKLETIDAQISECREALQQNPVNAHIRRYLFAALRDKKETLEEIMHYKNQQKTDS